MIRCDFYLGAHHPNWLAFSSVPLFVSAITLRKYGWARGVGRSAVRARTRWALDSGGYSELTKHGRWSVSASQYAREVQVWSRTIGGMEWAAIQDWMCESHVLDKTGLTVAEHQRRTIDSYLELRSIAPDVAWVPVVQGYELAEYERHLDDYASAGVDLAALPRVGVGSVCRRQGTLDGEAIITCVASRGLKVHAFGVKSDGLKRYSDKIASADSMAWSAVARRRPIRLEGCIGHRNCANCYRWARQWRDSIVNRGQQGDLFDVPNVYLARSRSKTKQSGYLEVPPRFELGNGGFADD